MKEGLGVGGPDFLQKDVKNKPDLFEPPLPSEASAQTGLNPLLEKEGKILSKHLNFQQN